MTVPPEPSSCPFVTRRRFLVGLGATVVLAACNDQMVSVYRPDPTSPTTDPSAAPPPGTFGGAEGRTLVVVEMGGGNDGLNMVVPHADGRYYDLRRSIRITDPIDLDGEVGFHPSLPRLARRYADGDVAIVEGVGVPDPNLSHFISMETWWTARPGGSDNSGWLGRFLDGTVGYTEPLAGITIGPGPSRAMLGNASYVVAIADASGLSPDLPPWIDTSDELMSMWEGFAAEDPATIDLDGVRTAIAASVAARGELEGAFGEGGDTGRRRRRRRAGLVDQLDLAAQLVMSTTAPLVIYVHGFGDFDTHQGELSRHQQLMGQLDEAVDRFFQTLESSGAADRVLLVTASEFGRRVRDNGSGTDHGTAAPHLVIGPTVRGGRYGEAPDLSRLDPAGNLAHSVDYRSVYATVLDRWLQADADEVLGATYERLPLL